MGPYTVRPIAIFCEFGSGDLPNILSFEKLKRGGPSNGGRLVFDRELISTVGVKDVKVEELYSLDVDEAQLGNIYGLVFLFKWRQERDSRETVDPPGLFFAQQVITNACATQAILSILMNSPEVDLGPTLSSFKEFTAEFPPEMKGLAISNSAPLREAHNSFARPEPFEMEKQQAKEDDDVFHFISYVPHNGSLYELDGLKPGPIKVAEYEGSWFKAIIPEVQARIARYSSKEIRFNLMIVTEDLRSKWRARLAQISESPEGQHSFEANQLSQSIQAEDEKFARWHAENVRRRHNYIPFIVELLQGLGEDGKLVPLLEQADIRMRERQAQQSANK